MDKDNYFIMTWEKFCDLAAINESTHGYAEVNDVVGNCQTQRELEQLLKKYLRFEDEMQRQFDEANKSAREKFAFSTLEKMRKAKITTIISDAGDRHPVEFIDLIREFLNMTIDEISEMDYKTDETFRDRHGVQRHRKSDRKRARDVYSWLQPKNFSLIVAQLPSEYKQIEEILEAVVQHAFKMDRHNQDLFKGMFEGGSLDIDPSDSSEDIRTILANKIDIIDSCILKICTTEQVEKWNEGKQYRFNGKGEAKSPRNHIIDDLLKKGKMPDRFKSGDRIGKQLAFCWSERDDVNFNLEWIRNKPSVADAEEAMVKCKLYVRKLPLLLDKLRKSGFKIPRDINENVVQNQQVLVRKIAQLNQIQESTIEKEINKAEKEIEIKQIEAEIRAEKPNDKDVKNYVKGFIERNFGETCSALLESGIEAYEGGNVSCQDGIKTRLEYAEQAIKVRTGVSKPRDIVDSYKDAYEGIIDKPGLFIALGMECISMSFDPQNVDADDLEIYDFEAAATYESVIEQDILGIREEAFNRYKEAYKGIIDKQGLFTEKGKREQMKLLPYAVQAMKDRFKPEQEAVTESRIIKWIQGQKDYPFYQHDSTNLSDLLTAKIKVEKTLDKLKQLFPRLALRIKNCESQKDLERQLTIEIREKIDHANDEIRSNPSQTDADIPVVKTWDKLEPLFPGIVLDMRNCNSQQDLVTQLTKKIREKANNRIKLEFYKLKLQQSKVPEDKGDIPQLKENLSKKVSSLDPKIDIKKLRDALNEHPHSLKKGLTIPPKRKLPYDKMQPNNDENRMRLDQYVYSEPCDIKMLLQKCSQLFPEGMNKSDITEIKKTIQLEHEDFNKFCSQYRKKLQEFGIPHVSIQMLDFSFIYSQCKSKERLYGKIQADKKRYVLEISEFNKKSDMQPHCLYMLESRHKKTIPIDTDDISIINSLGDSIVMPVFELLTTKEQNLLKSRALKSLLSAGENCTAFDDKKEYHMATLSQIISDNKENYTFLRKHKDRVCKIYEDRLNDCIKEIFQKGNANDHNLELLAKIINIIKRTDRKRFRIAASWFENPQREITKDYILTDPRINQWYEIQKGEFAGRPPTKTKIDHRDIMAAIIGNQTAFFDTLLTIGNPEQFSSIGNTEIRALAIQQARRGKTHFARKLMNFDEIYHEFSNRPDIMSQMIDEAFTKDDDDFVAKAMLEFKPFVLIEKDGKYEDKMAKKIIEKQGKCSQVVIDWLARRACESNSTRDFLETFGYLPDDKKSHLIKLFCSSYTGDRDKRFLLIKGILMSLKQNPAMKEINPLTQMHSDFFTTADFNRELKIAESIWLPRYWGNQYPDVNADTILFSIFSPIILARKLILNIIPRTIDLVSIVIITMFAADPTPRIRKLKKFFWSVYTDCIKPWIDLVTTIVINILIILTSIISIINFSLRCIRLKNRDSIYTITRNNALKESDPLKKVQYTYNFLGLVAGLKVEDNSKRESIITDINKVINSIPEDCDGKNDLTKKSRQIIESLSNNGASEVEQRPTATENVVVKCPLSGEHSRHNRQEWRNVDWPDGDEDLKSLEDLSKRYPGDDSKHSP